MESKFIDISFSFMVALTGYDQKQDHYQVLGLSHLRYTATPEQIKIARMYLDLFVGYDMHILCADRKKVLKHHPDKKAGVSHSTNDDAFFKCIQKAFEVLTHPERRHQFDSVDPHYLALDEDAPTASDFKGKEKDDDFFFNSMGPVFEREARFSKKTPVPMLGCYDDPKDTVEAFYDFWYNFDSWRSFEYLDKEVNEGSDRSVTGMDTWMSNMADAGVRSAVMTRDTRRRRTSQNVHAARRKTPRDCAASLILPLAWIRVSRG